MAAINRLSIAASKERDVWITPRARSVVLEHERVNNGLASWFFLPSDAAEHRSNGLKVPAGGEVVGE
jgi:hypothetical protein